jgi:molybdate transport system substrate-binding protein
MDAAQKRGLIRAGTRIDLLSSRLVLIAPERAPIATRIEPGFPIAELLGNGRLAMCDPMMMPAGRYGRAALIRLGVWKSVRRKIANAANVRAALTYVSRGEAPLGIVFDTDAALDPGVKVVGVFPSDTHPPIVYPAAIVSRSANPDAARLMRFLQSSSARVVFIRYGYRVLSATAAGKRARSAGAPGGSASAALKASRCTAPAACAAASTAR